MAHLPADYVTNNKPDYISLGDERLGRRLNFCLGSPHDLYAIFIQDRTSY